MSNNSMYNYWGKLGDENVLCHLLIYHCLDVAAVGQVLLRLPLQQDDYEDIFTQNITHDKEISLSFITFFLIMHDLGKFSERFQNTNQELVNNVHGRLSDKPYTVKHDELGFCLCQKKILPKILHENLLSLDMNVDICYLQDVLKSWFQSVTMHHNRPSNIDFQNKPDNLGIHFSEENIAAACIFVGEAVKFMLNIKSKKPLLLIHESLHYTYNYTSILLKYLAIRSDWLVSSNPEYFPPSLTPLSIEHYWDKALQNAKQAVKDAEISHSEIIEDNNYFFRKIDRIYLQRQGITLINEARDHIENHRIDEAIECYYRANELFKKANSKELFNKYDLELRRLELNKYKVSQGINDEKSDRCLFEILRNLRNELIKGNKHNNVLPNESLKAMATIFPQDLESFKKIYGVDKEHEIYGELFIEKIVTYCRLNNIEQETKSECSYPTKLQETLELSKQSLTLEEIALKRGLEVSTIIRQIEDLILYGAEIPMDKFVNANKQEHIMSVISKIGCEKLSPIKKMLGDAFTFEEIRLVRAYKIRNDK